MRYMATLFLLLMNIGFVLGQSNGDTTISKARYHALQSNAAAQKQLTDILFGQTDFLLDQYGRLKVIVDQKNDTISQLKIRVRVKTGIANCQYWDAQRWRWKYKFAFQGLDYRHTRADSAAQALDNLMLTLAMEDLPCPGWFDLNDEVTGYVLADPFLESKPLQSQLGNEQDRWYDPDKSFQFKVEQDYYAYEARVKKSRLKHRPGHQGRGRKKLIRKPMRKH